jgi:DNA-binding NtrC family response regulator
VGGNQELRVDVRLIAATNRDIIEAIRQNHFREDLYHRLNVVQFRPPPLRERGEDIVLLAEHFLRQFNATMNKTVRGISRAAQQSLMGHHWPGSVRELRNVVERAVILERTDEIQPGNLPDFRLETRLRKGSILADAPPQSLDDAVMQFEKELILSTYDVCLGNLTRTAEQLRLTRHALRYRLQRLNIQLDPGAEEEPVAAGGKETV